MFSYNSVQGPVARKELYPTDSDFFNCARKALKLITPKILSSHRLKSVFNLKIMTFLSGL